MNLQTFIELDKRITQKTKHIITKYKVDQNKLFAGIISGTGIGMVAAGIFITLLYPTQTPIGLTVLMVIGGFIMAVGLKI